MREYTFDDTENEGYEIVVPKETVDQIIKDYREKTFYLTVCALSLIIGFLVGVLV